MTLTTNYAIIVAGGSSCRMGFDKLTAPLAGHPVLSHTLCAFEQCAAITGIFLVCDPLREREFLKIIQHYHIKKFLAFAPSGKERQHSVWNGILAAGENADYLAVHDAARPLITPQLIANCIQSAICYGAACVAEPLVDTIHRADEKKILNETFSREGLWRMQTPQIFRRDDLYQAYLLLIQENILATDEASVFLRMGKPVFVEEARDYNFKVTLPKDLELAEIILKHRQTA